MAEILRGRARSRQGLFREWIRTRTPANSWPALVGLAVFVAMLGLQQLIEPGTQRLLTSVFLFVALATLREVGQTRCRMSWTRWTI